MHNSPLVRPVATLADTQSIAVNSPKPSSITLSSTLSAAQRLEQLVQASPAPRVLVKKLSSLGLDTATILQNRLPPLPQHSSSSSLIKDVFSRRNSEDGGGKGVGYATLQEKLAAARLAMEKKGVQENIKGVGNTTAASASAAGGRVEAAAPVVVKEKEQEIVVEKIKGSKAKEKAAVAPVVVKDKEQDIVVEKKKTSTRVEEPAPVPVPVQRNDLGGGGDDDDDDFGMQDGGEFNDHGVEEEHEDIAITPKRKGASSAFKKYEAQSSSSKRGRPKKDKETPKKSKEKHISRDSSLDIDVKRKEKVKVTREREPSPEKKIKRKEKYASRDSSPDIDEISARIHSSSKKSSSKSKIGKSAEKPEKVERRRDTYENDRDEDTDDQDESEQGPNDFWIRGYVQSSNDSKFAYGQKSKFLVQKRINDRIIQSDEGIQIKLIGSMRVSEAFDSQTAQKFEDGFPHHWRQILRSFFVRSSRSSANEDEEENRDDDVDSEKTIELQTPSRASSSSSRTPQTITSSRSKRKRVPPLDFWCNERIVDGKIIRPDSADLPLWSPTMTSSKKKKKQ